VDVAGQSRVRSFIAVQIYLFIIEVDVNVPIPSDPEQLTPVVGIGIDERRVRSAPVARLVGADVF
jgi:hypothetical protein